MVVIRRWRQGSLLGNASLPQLGMRGQNPVCKVALRGMDVVGEALGAGEDAVAF